MRCTLHKKLPVRGAPRVRRACRAPQRLCKKRAQKARGAALCCAAARFYFALFPSSLPLLSFAQSAQRVVCFARSCCRRRARQALARKAKMRKGCFALLQYSLIRFSGRKNFDNRNTAFCAFMRWPTHALCTFMFALSIFYATLQK